MRLALSTLALSGLAAAPSQAANLELSLDIPTISVAEYHRPYVAVWVERPDQSAVKTLTVWYNLKAKNQEGEKYLKDLRQWWRRGGRELSLAADGLTGPSRAPGKQQVVFKAPDLPAGQYSLVVEAAREAGGREVVRTPFQWPPKARQVSTVKGTSELGLVTLVAKP